MLVFNIEWETLWPEILLFKEAARIARYGGHHLGSFTEQNLSWIKYPNIDKRFYLQSVGSFHKINSFPIENITVTLESTAKLKENSLFNSIKNLEINFRYYDHEKEHYVHLGTKKVKKHFAAGVNEVFEATLENVPLNLIRDSYFWRGEFIISEIKDFEIPDIKTTYRTLLSRVRKKTIPVAYNTPLESRVYYVAVGDRRKITIHEILKTIFGKQFKIEDNKLYQVEQFTNTLGEYTNLREIKGQNKKGRWFIFTNSINQHYLDYKFGVRDKVALSYITGNGLSHQIDKTAQVYSHESTDDNTPAFLSLGKILANSEVYIVIRPKQRRGVQAKVWSENFVGKIPYASSFFRCKFKFSSFSEFSESFDFTQDLSREFSRISLIINNNEYGLKQLVENQKVLIYRELDPPVLHIKNTSSIYENIAEGQEHDLLLKLKPFSETIFNGAMIEEWHGKDGPRCIKIIGQAAHHHKIPISVRSKNFNNWKKFVKPHIIGEDKTYHQNFSVEITSLIINFFN